MIICADDFGLSSDINEAVAELAQAGKVSAVSVMAALEEVNQQALAPLLALEGRIDLGLHLVFTDGHFITGGSPMPGFRALLANCWLGRFPPELAQNEIAAQYEAFSRKAGRPPDFIDGHMHIHQFPVIRQALASFIAGLPEPKPYVRNTHLPLGAIWRQGVSPAKTWFISAPGKSMKRLLAKSRIPTNEGFTGIYDFALSRRYPQFFAKFTAHAASSSMLLMVHPGKTDVWRRAEFEAISAATGLEALATRFLRPAEERKA